MAADGSPGDRRAVRRGYDVGLEIPSEVRWLFKIIVGDEWPLGDEEELRDLGAVWDQAAEELNGLAPALSGATGAVLTAIEGMAADEYRKFMKDLGAKLPAMVNASRELGNLARQTALEVEYSKYMVIGSLILLAQSIVAALSASFFTFGASAAAIPAMQTAARFTVKAILRKLFQAILQGVIRQVALDAAVQGIQVLKGDRTSWDWEKTKGAAIAGAVGGVIGFGLGAGISKLAPQLEGKVLTEVVKGGSHELLTSLAVDKVNRSSETDWSAFTAGATEGVFDGVKGRAGGGNSNATSNISDMNVTDIGDIPGAGGVPTVPTMGSGDSTRGSDTTLDTSDVPQVYVPGGSVPQTQVGATAASDVPGTAVAGTANPVTGVSRPVNTTDTVARTETATVTHATTPVVTVSHGTPTAQDPLGINTPVQPSNNTNAAAVGVAETHHTSASVATPTTVNTSVAVAPASEATSAPATDGTTPHATAPATVASTPVATPTASATTISSPAQTVAVTPTSTTVSPVGPTSVSTVTSPQSPVSAVASSPTAASVMTPAAAGTPTISTPASATPMAGTASPAAATPGTASPTNAPSTAVPASGTSATAGPNLTPAVVNSTASPAKGSAGTATSSDSAPVPPAVSAVTTDPEAVSRGLAALDAAAREQAERQARTLVDEAADRQTIAAVAYAVAQAGPAVAAALANTLGTRRTRTTGTSAEPMGVRLVNPEDASSVAPQSMVSEPSSDGSTSSPAPIMTGPGANDETTPNSSPAFTSGTEVQASREQSQIQDASQQDHAVLVEALPKDAEGAPSRFPDPFASDWAKRVNDGGITVPGRSNNCADLGLSVLSTWFGKPTVAGSRTNGIGGEPGSTTRQQELLGTDFQRLPGADPTTKYDLLQQQLIAAGPGAAALIITTGKQPTAPSSHTWNAVNHDGTIVWIDAQAGRVSAGGPLYVDGVTDVWAIPLDADSHPIQRQSANPAPGREVGDFSPASLPFSTKGPTEPASTPAAVSSADSTVASEAEQDAPVTIAGSDGQSVLDTSPPHVIEMWGNSGLLVRTIDAKRFKVELGHAADRNVCWSYLHSTVRTPLYKTGDDSGPFGRFMGILADPAVFFDGPGDDTRFVSFDATDQSSNTMAPKTAIPRADLNLTEKIEELRNEVQAAGGESNSEVVTHGFPLLEGFRGLLYVPKEDSSWDSVKNQFQKNVDALAIRLKESGQPIPDVINVFKSDPKGQNLEPFIKLTPAEPPPDSQSTVPDRQRSTPAQPSTAPNSTRPATETARPAPQLRQER
ncbi:WXG100-like domain-containing protein, partial [Actinoplanes derwentensis]|uniref:WXG100-like domain-containing protein n=1 Tax=Actinoplanes derwentensis TaxID=113562 RepID=UPI004039EB8B